MSTTLPLSDEKFKVLAKELGLSEEEVNETELKDFFGKKIKRDKGRNLFDKG